MELNEYISILRKRWISVAIIALATLAATAAVTLLMTPKYSATNRMFFAVEAGESVSDLAQGSTFTEKQITSYAEVATTPLVLGPVIDDLGLDTTPTGLKSALTVTVPPETVMVDITGDRRRDPGVGHDPGHPRGRGDEEHDDAGRDDRAGHDLLESRHVMLR
ncbi:YveK family protein [Georgenia sp. SUBG003]|uniref:YveK family protein n=1 Tax=Georgenia sp. SUBG003 TaxID=1497974 RepID=UPI003AB6DCA5